MAARLALFLMTITASSTLGQERAFGRPDSLRGTVTPERAWWDVRHYDLAVAVSPTNSSVSGRTIISYEVIAPGRVMQIDLMEPMDLDSVIHEGERLRYRRDGAAFFVQLTATQTPGALHRIEVHYRGTPRVAPNPPWDGGFVWAEDGLGRPWFSTANQGVGASVWWPNKDHQSDEPDSMQIAVTVPSTMAEVSNGRLRDSIHNGDGTTTWVWHVSNPINNYNVTLNAGSYVHFRERYEGRDGPLDLDYWVLDENRPAAERQFEQVVPMLRCFEDWFGPYPFYEDGYKLVDAPYLGMEHQSAIAYGNGYQNGYLGADLSGTGRGLHWDFIIVHESAHEWFGNNVSTADIADQWVHEGFASYAESLYVECEQGEEAGAEYVVGLRRNILNDRPVIGTYGVNGPGSVDMYYKGANLLHTLRQLVDDDEAWRAILRGLNDQFRHRVVTSHDVERYVARQAGFDLTSVFDQYLRHAAIPIPQYDLDGSTLHYRWDADVPGFDMPVRVVLADGRYSWIAPSTEGWKSVEVDPSGSDLLSVDENFYVDIARVRR